MKKKLSIIFCFAILVAIAIPAIAAAPVYSEMPDSELWASYAELTREMISRGLLTEKDVVFNSGTVTRSSTFQTNTSKTYVLNTNTHKIHMPSCSSVSDIKEKNKMIVEGDINTWLNKGYDRCKKCNPK